MSNETIDLGDGHTLRFTGWWPDRALNPQYTHLPDVEKWGATIKHPPGPNYQGNSGECMGAVTFDGPVQAELVPANGRWQVINWEPLTISPSVLCSCGDHGYVRDGRWVRA